MPTDARPCSNNVSVETEERRMTLRTALLGALAATGYLSISKSAHAQERTSLASLQNQVNQLIQSDAAMSAAIAAIQTSSTDLGTAVIDIEDAITAILDGDQPVGHVDGTVRIRPSSIGATAANAGRLNYNSVTNSLQFSDGQAWRTLSSSSPSIFIRYGNTTAPFGCEVIETGIACAAHHSHSGSISEPILLPAATDGSAVASDAYAEIYRIVTGSVFMAPIPQNAVVNGARILAPRPTAVFWGRTTPPPGWTSLYTGFAMAGHYTLTGVGQPMLIDSAFSGGSAGPGTSTFIYPLTVTGGGGIPGSGRYRVQGVMAMKNE
jgi:hypothetical protein